MGQESNIAVEVVKTEETNREEGGLRTTLARKLDEYEYNTLPIVNKASMRAE